MPHQQPAIWPIYKVVIFDCDSTLSSIEGIDELAHLIEQENLDRGRAPDQSAPGMAVKVAALTLRAMEGEIPLEAVFGQRLYTINPTQSQVHRIAAVYRSTVIPDARRVIAALQFAGIEVYIVSGGLIEAVREFGSWLGVPRQNIFAVEMEYDQLAGEWWRYWEQPAGRNPQANYRGNGISPLSSSQGKNRIIARLRAEHPGRAMLVGDGLSDLEASHEVDLFVGFGGVKQRQIVLEQAAIYLHTPALSSILPLAAGWLGNRDPHRLVWADGMQRLSSGEAHFSNPEQQHTFFSAMGVPKPG